MIPYSNIISMNLIGINQIKQEREEQITKHGRTVEYDVEHNGNRELSRFAGMLITKEPFLNAGISDLLLEKLSPENWDMDIKVKMFRKSYTERLVIAGALIAAELDRLNYIEK